MAKQSFNATIKIRGINPYVLVSRTRARAIKPDWRKPMPVKIRVNRQPKSSPWRINMMPAGDGSFYLYLHGDVRRASNTKVGDRVRVEIAFDHQYAPGPTDQLPNEFVAALSSNSRAAANWNALVPSRQKEIARYFVGLKSDAARQRNLAKILKMLASARRGRRPSSP